MKNTIYFAAAAIAVLTVAGCGNKGGEDLVIVNGEKIGREEMHKYLETKTSMVVQVPNGPETAVNLNATPAFQALQDLIVRQITIQLAKDDGVAPKPADIEREIEFRKKDNPNYVTGRLAMGMTLQDIKEQVEFDLSREGILTKGIDVTADEAKKYIADNKPMFTNPERVKVLYILGNKPETRKKVEQDLAMGKPFQTVALAYSEDPNIRTNQANLAGQAQFIASSQLNPAVKPSIDKLQPSKRTGWMKVQDAQVMFYLDTREEPTPMPVNDVLVEKVQRSLKIQRGQLAVDLEKRIRDRMLESKVDIKDKHLKAMWDDHITRLRQLTGAAEPEAAKPADETEE